MTAASGDLAWGGVVRLGLEQAAIGSVGVLMTATLTPVMMEVGGSPECSMIHRARGALARLRIGSYGASRAVAFVIGGFLGALGSDVTCSTLGNNAEESAAAFLVEAVHFAGAAALVGLPRGESGERVACSSGDEGERLFAALN